jgi:pimeloyl-ACP methyl ester carboxylesterase
MGELVALQSKPGGYMESQSGLQRSNPRLYGRLETATDRELAFLVFHPTSNFFGHYLLDALPKAGASIFALNTRYIGNDTMLVMERAVQDVGVGIEHLRKLGFKRVVLIGNSGGGSLASLYQQQAESITITTTPDGRPFDLQKADVPPAHGIALVAAHLGRAEQMLTKIDPSVSDESSDPQIDATLDMFDPVIGPPYAPDWVARYRQAQSARLHRITTWVESRIEELEATRPPETADEAFIIHRTQADPRNLDLALDANDRAQGTLGGEAQAYNFAANGLARFCSLRSFLSQWSPWHTRAHGPRCLTDVSVPKLIVDHTADQTVFPSQVAQWREAAGEASFLALRGGTHYLQGQPEMVAKLAKTLTDWGRAL